MMDAIFGRSGRVALYFGSVVLAYALGSFARAEPFDYDPWAVD